MFQSDPKVNARTNLKDTRLTEPKPAEPRYITVREGTSTQSVRLSILETLINNSGFIMLSSGICVYIIKKKKKEQEKKKGCTKVFRKPWAMEHDVR